MRVLPCLLLSLCRYFIGIKYIFRSDPERARYSFLAAVFLGLLLAFSHFVMIRGREWGAWAIAAFYVVCLLVVLPTYSYRPHMAAYVMGLLFPLAGVAVAQ
jgi:uncharacterized membrane protein (UPF0136 family)